MTAFKSYSQAAQDRFVMAVLNGKTDGVFLDVGCCHPIELSNTYGLEQIGWRGLLIDRDKNAIELCKAHRAQPYNCWACDAVKGDWAYGIGSALSVFEEKPNEFLQKIDYLSLDIDECTSPALRAIMAEEIYRRPLFRVITVEHDCYRFGPGPKAEIEKRLSEAGYDLVCEDVCSAEGLAFENWYVAPELSAAADRFRCKGKRWTEIFPT